MMYMTLTHPSRCAHDTHSPIMMCTRHSLTHHDVLVDDVHEVVAVGPRVLVPEADHVTQLVHDDAELVAVLADADHLRAAAALADERAAPVSAPTARNIDVSELCR